MIVISKFAEWPVVKLEMFLVLFSGSFRDGEAVSWVPSLFSTGFRDGEAEERGSAATEG